MLSFSILVSTDNLDLGCGYMEKAAAERAIREIDDVLVGEFALRRKHREQQQIQYSAHPFNAAAIQQS